jgi:hypothetical protein
MMMRVGIDMGVNTQDVEIPDALYDRILNHEREAVIEGLQIIENYTYFHVPAMYRHWAQTLGILSIARQLLDTAV